MIYLDTFFFVHRIQAEQEPWTKAENKREITAENHNARPMRILQKSFINDTRTKIQKTYY